MGHRGAAVAEDGDSALSVRCARAQVNTARPEAIRDALRSLRARLKSRSINAQMLALTLLEMQHFSTVLSDFVW